MPASKSLLRSFCESTLPVLQRHVSGRRLISSAKAVMETDRWLSFDRFHETTRTLVNEYEKAGAKAEVHAAPTGGRIGSGRWVIAEAEDVRHATVDVISPVRRRVADYRKDPVHFVGWSGATAPGGMVSELTVIDSRRELESLPAGALRGKTVLTRLPPQPLLGALSNACASALICDPAVRASRDATAWLRLGWGGLSLEDASRRMVALSIPAATGRELRALLKKHDTVRLRTVVDVRHYAGTHDVVSGIVRGRERPQQEVWALAHTMEPGALDNASGVAACLEIARVLEKLIASGRVARPRRSIRLVTAYECYGFFQYYEEAPRETAPLAGVVLDAIGAQPAVCGRHLSWVKTVPMSAGFVDNVGEAMLRAALRRDNPGYRLAISPFRPSADNLLGDPQYGFPCPWLTAYCRPGGKPYDAYHSSADTVEVLSARGLATSTAAMAGYLYYLADAGDERAAQLASAETRRALRALGGMKAADEAARVAERTHVSLAALKRWVADKDVLRQMAEWESEVSAAARRRKPARKRPSRRRIRGPGRVARRIAPIAPTAANMPPDMAKALREIKLPAWALFTVDGKRTVADIARILSLETKKKVSAETVLRFLEIHEKLGYIEWLK